MTLPADLLLTLDQAADILYCPTATLRRICDNGLPFATNVGTPGRNRYRIPAGNLDELKMIVEEDAKQTPGTRRSSEIAELRERIKKLEQILTTGSTGLDPTHQRTTTGTLPSAD